MRVTSETPRDATRRMSATELVLRFVAAATPSQQNYHLALKWSSHRRVPPRGAAVPPRGAAGSTSRRDVAAPRGGTRAMRSISSVAAASAQSQQQQQATAVSRDLERSTGRKNHWAAPRIVFRHRNDKLYFIRITGQGHTGVKSEKYPQVRFM